jgi:hypothetical protein
MVKQLLICSSSSRWTLCQLLHQIATKEKPEEKEKIDKNRSLVGFAFFV